MATTRRISPKVSPPIVSISTQLAPLKGAQDPIGLHVLTEIAQQASDILADVREHMLAPHPRKNPPVYTGSQVAALCGIDRARLNYLASRGELPAGSVESAGKSRQFTLEEARTCIKQLGIYPPRPVDGRGRIIAIGNFKGGVSKTTTTMTLAQGLTLRGRRVLVVDLDPQASLSTLNGILADTEVKEAETVLPLIYGDETSLTYAVQKSYWDGLDLIPSSSALFSAEFYLPMKQSRDRQFEFWNVLKQGLHPLTYDYDAILIDTPPALSYLTINAFMAADGIIVPTPPNALDFASSTQFWTLFSDLTSSMQERIPDLNKTFDFLYVLMAKVDNQQAASGVVRDWIMRTYGSLVLPVEIPVTTVTQSAAAEFGTIYDIAKYDGSMKTYQRAREAYDRLAEYIDQKLVALWNAETTGKG